MRWVTRSNANVDRIACPWLIRRFVDAEAEFVFVSRDTDPATITDGIPYDMTGVELGHVDGRCSFESILVKYDLTGDPALVLLGRVVHGADIPADLGTSPLEAHGLRAMAYGFAALHGEDDHEKIRLESPLYDALYAWCRAQTRGAGG
ncbi:MAG TPA: chromate resistance protein ChrB domain-containing protein [Longimicrobiaceae bacterium]|nr:chromate resistance protein ChrB domain-containing protein [Longimicrobiaceae bacterium]